MERSGSFLLSVLDSLEVSLAVIDSDGAIRYVNQSWISFGQCNGEPDSFIWSGVNYLAVCDVAAAAGDPFGLKAAAGIRAVLNGECEAFSLEYPCHSLDEKRWFMMDVRPLLHDPEHCCVVAHHNITERKLAEEQVLNLSRRDGLTGIFNRRYFEAFYQQEWRRSVRETSPLSLIFFDLDYFKRVNDRYGHQRGDEYLKRIAECANGFAKRPGDVCARYGGEEFVLVLGNTAGNKAEKVATKLLSAVEALQIPNEDSPVRPVVTISAGVVTVLPEQQTDRDDVIRRADRLLYKAKKQGRNRICTATVEYAQSRVEESLI